MYSETQFINKYNSLKLTTFTDFMKTARVITGSQLLPIKDYLKTKNISSQQLKLLFEFIRSKEIYLRTFYKKSMNPYELHIKAAPSKEYNNNQLVQYKNIIRNQFYRQIMEKTKPGTENIRTYGELLDNLFNRLIIDYKLLTPSALHYLEQGRLGSVFSSYYFRASIMNPYLVYSLQETLLKGTRVFSPTLGWGSYCYGFLESNKVTTYVGTDVIPEVCKKVSNFAKKHYSSKTVTIYCNPSESLYNKEFLKQYREHFDTVFFSPPYYDLEKYEGRNQSIQQYKTYDEWLQKYWKQTVLLCYEVLQKNGKMCFIISNYRRKGEYLNLVSDMVKVTSEYFKSFKTIPMKNKMKYVNETGNEEQILLFKKM